MVDNPVVVGVSYRTAPVAVRERVAVPVRDLPGALASLRTIPDVQEAVILSTCNRVELYAGAPHPADAAEALTDFLSTHKRLEPAPVRPHLYQASGEEAVRHLFRVAAGLDSMVPGESEIAAQVKQAYQIAHAHHATGPVLNPLFQKALHCAKLVRSRTGIAEGQGSIGSVVVALARRLFRDRLSRCEVLLWGAGKAAEATVRHLMKSGVGQVWVVNRTQTKAQDLASLCQGGWLSWEQARRHLAHVDIAIVCTQAPHYVIDQADAAWLLSQRAGRPLCLIDLAVPRNVDPTLKRLAGVQLYDLDDLQAVAQTTLTARQQELGRCADIIEEQTAYFVRRWKPVPYKEDDPCQVAEVSLLA